MINIKLYYLKHKEKGLEISWARLHRYIFVPDYIVQRYPKVEDRIKCSFVYMYEKFQLNNKKTLLEDIDLYDIVEVTNEDFLKLSDEEIDLFFFKASRALYFERGLYKKEFLTFFFNIIREQIINEKIMKLPSYLKSLLLMSDLKLGDFNDCCDIVDYSYKPTLVFQINYEESKFLYIENNKVFEGTYLPNTGYKVRPLYEALFDKKFIEDLLYLEKNIDKIIDKGMHLFKHKCKKSTIELVLLREKILKAISEFKIMGGIK